MKRTEHLTPPSVAVIIEPMNQLDLFEDMAEEWFERKLVRLLGGRLHPIDIANTLVRALEDGRSSGPQNRILAPNRFVVLVNSRDFDALQPQLQLLQERLAGYIVRLATYRGMAVVGSLRIAIKPSASIPAAHLRVRAALEMPAMAAGDDMQATQPMSAVPYTPAPTEETPDVPPQEPQ